jgi:hypothetical protein
VELGSKPAMVIELLSHDNYNDNYVELLNGSYLVPEVLVFMYTFSQFNSNLAFTGNPGVGINTNRVDVLKKDNNIIWTSNFYDGTSFSTDEMGTWNQISNLYTLENMVVKGDTMICTSSDFFNYLASYDGGQTFNTYEYPELISGSLLTSPSNLSIVELNNVLYLEKKKHINVFNFLKITLKEFYIRKVKKNTDYWIVQTNLVKSKLSYKWNLSNDKILTLPFFQDIMDSPTCINNLNFKILIAFVS